MAFLDSLQPDGCAIVERYLETVFFPKGTLILEQGSRGDGCYLIGKRQIRLEVDVGKTNTDVAARFLPAARYHKLRGQHPKVGPAVLTGIARDLAGKLRRTIENVASAICC